MKYFSVKMRLSKEDYKQYDKIYFTDSLKISFKRIGFIFFIGAIIYAFLDLYLAVSAFAYGLVVMLVPLLVNREFISKTRDKSEMFSREMTVEFYDNHLRLMLLPDEKHRSYNEKHYGFDTITKILESNENFYFTFKDNTMLLIPKRFMDKEGFEMTKNLIANLFINKYQFIKTKN